jgi:hypothetical protein
MKAVALTGLLLTMVASVLVADHSRIRQTPLDRLSASPTLTVVLLLDVSASVSRLPLFIEPRFVQVFNAFLQGLKPGDRAGIGVVARRLRLSQLTSDPRELSTIARGFLQVADTDRLGPSPLWDAVDETIALVAGQTGRRAIVLFSDGKSSGNTHGLDEVTAHARQLGVSINAVVAGESSPGQGQSTDHLDPADLTESLVQATGGRQLLDRPANPRDRNPARLIAQIMAALH